MRNGIPEAKRIYAQNQSGDIRKLKAELRRVTEERDIQKKATEYFAKEAR